VAGEVNLRIGRVCIVFERVRQLPNFGPK